MRDALPRALLLIHGGIEAVLTVAMIDCTICSNLEINPEYEKVLSKTYLSLTKNKVTPRIMQGFISGASLTIFCMKSY